MDGFRKKLNIKTPEGIVFPLMIASPFSRFAALVIDAFVKGVVVSIISSLAAGVFTLFGMDMMMGAYMVAAFIAGIGYPICFEWYWRGQTVGKRIMKIQVMDEQGLKLKFSQVVVRNLLRVVDSIPGAYLVAGVSCYLTAGGQRLGDIAANTIVVQHVPLAEPDLSQVSADKYNSFREYPHIAARLRQNVTPDQAGVALQALIRRDKLDDDARPQLFAAIREHLEKLAKFPADVSEGISDEQYVRNAVDLLFR